VQWTARLDALALIACVPLDTVKDALASVYNLRRERCCRPEHANPALATCCCIGVDVQQLQRVPVHLLVQAAHMVDVMLTSDVQAAGLGLPTTQHLFAMCDT
jgi:hypothetical protein